MAISKIDSIYNKYYSSISKLAFYDVLRLDPTFEKEKDSLGKYSKWLLQQYMSGTFNSGNIHLNHVSDVLKRFHAMKLRLLVDKRNIFNYKDFTAVENMLNDNTSYLATSRRQEVRERQKARHSVNLETDTEVVFENASWVIYSPKTYAASCKLGEGTRWCTASTESNYYYNQYTKDGPLYIFINKLDSSVKYQFHVETESFMDRDDITVDIPSFISKNKDLIDFFETTNFVDLYDMTAFKNSYIKDNFVIYKDRVLTYIGEDKNISLPDNIRIIDDNAFVGNCIIENVTLPKGLTTIGIHAFRNCSSLKSIIIPDSVTCIDDVTFCQCYNLESVTLGKNITYIGEAAFSDCRALSHITIPDSVTHIDKKAFQDCNSLTNITIPDSVVTIGKCAFYRCSRLTFTTIGKNVTNIGEYAFDGCFSLIEVYNRSKLLLTAGNKANGYISANAKHIIQDHADSYLKESNGYIFYEDGNNSYLVGYTKTKSSLTLPKKTPMGNSYDIYQHVFSNRDIITVKIPGSVRHIGKCAFYGCDNLKTVVIKPGIESIGELAFFRCISLKYINLPDSITNIDDLAFGGCWGLSDDVRDILNKYSRATH